MYCSEPDQNLLSLVAAAADICLKPWHHSVVGGDISDVDADNSSLEQDLVEKAFFEFIVRIECRTREGERHPGNDLELEVYRSGNDLNLMLSWSEQPERPILWQGQHSVWMDCNSGQRCSAPEGADELESLARRLRALFIAPDQN